MSNPSQLFLLADHIKLSLLERQRAISLNLEPNSQDGEISRSLESLREGLEGVEARLDNEDSSSSELREQTTSLRQQYQDLSSQFYGNESSSTTAKATLTTSDDPSLAEDFVHASSDTTTLKHPTPQHPLAKSVRFTDSLTTDADEDPNRNALLGRYRDSPSPPSFDVSNASNEQIHNQHATILREQDDHLDRLGESIGRQHQLSIQIGDELEGQVALLDEVDGHVDRHVGRLETARKRLGKFSRKASDRSGIMTIIGLIIILVILIVILK
ncbi:hypothetical protein AJ80_06987 [Polytolypa hystricis UAMH7299]|uniref:t-SNARE coiled-coil homology domain-containing protein n=1 Tax=Polytolypa hystricis (strain UAMH7299) TaxID=1447883 RepID=A0A2B7XR74_POLH7|nr:hypothetical protein AJ80_06987 [Polytolypa hystricis UAMH7299]